MPFCVGASYDKPGLEVPSTTIRKEANSGSFQSSYEFEKWIPFLPLERIVKGQSIARLPSGQKREVPLSKGPQSACPSQPLGHPFCSAVLQERNDHSQSLAIRWCGDSSRGWELISSLPIRRASCMQIRHSANHQSATNSLRGQKQEPEALSVLSFPQRVPRQKQPAFNRVKNEKVKCYEKILKLTAQHNSPLLVQLSA